MRAILFPYFLKVLFSCSRKGVIGMKKELLVPVYLVFGGRAVGGEWRRGVKVSSRREATKVLRTFRAARQWIIRHRCTAPWPATGEPYFSWLPSRIADSLPKGTWRWIAANCTFVVSVGKTFYPPKVTNRFLFDAGIKTYQ